MSSYEACGGLNATAWYESKSPPRNLFAFCSPLMPYCSTEFLANSRLLFLQINFSQRLDGTSPVSTVAALRQRRFVFIVCEDRLRKFSLGRVLLSTPHTSTGRERLRCNSLT